MRKVIALILSLTIALALVGCVDSSNGEIQSGQVDTDLSDNASVSDDTNSNDEDLTDVSTTEQVVEKLEVAIEETVLVDESGIKITAKSLDLNGFLGPEVKLLIENNSGQDLTFQCRNTSVNGDMAEPMMSVDVSNGKKANDSLVVTNSDLETWFNGSGDERIDSSAMNAVGFVHCVGSRDEKAGNGQCSKVCCITAIKQAIELKEMYPNAQIYCFYMDLRLFGKKFEDFYTKAQRDHGIHFIRGRVSEVSENIDGKVIVKAEDTLAGKPIKVTLDLLVLMAGMLCNPDSAKMASMISLPADSDNFLKSKDNIKHITSSPKKGIYYAGACTGPKTVPETLAEARSVALEMHLQIKGI